MSVWRYKAVAGGAGGSVRTGELAAESAAAARAALRRAGLTVLDVRPIGKQIARGPGGRMTGFGIWRSGNPAIRRFILAHLRRRRVHVKGELFDSLATMLDAGLPLLEAVGTAAEGAKGGLGRGTGWGSSWGLRSMLLDLHSALREGTPLAEALSRHPGWFDAAESAMVAAGQHRGEMAQVLRRLAERHEHAGDLSQKLAGALAYPALVAMVGLGVVVFLSLKTLPDLAGILSEAGVPAPGLTVAVMAAGQAIASWGWLAAVAAVLLILAAGAAIPYLSARGLRAPAWARRLVPQVCRRLLIARLASELAAMVRTGVPAVEALRVLAPTFGPPLGSSLRAALEDAAGRVERGQGLDEALDDPLWFDAELRRLVAAGQASGELDTMLARLAERQSRRARRVVDRLASLLEPAVILLLAVLVGTVAMAAVLPLIRLREVL